VTDFWKRWLTAWAWGVIAFGLLLVGAGFAATDTLAMETFRLFGVAPFAPDAMHRFSIGLMGAVTMGWGITYLAAFRALHLLSEPQAAPIWRNLTMGTLLWYVIDSWISVANGVGMNAVSNTLLLVLFLIPVLRSGVMRMGG
jgi:hypothetical protein